MYKHLNMVHVYVAIQITDMNIYMYKKNIHFNLGISFKDKIFLSYNVHVHVDHLDF